MEENQTTTPAPEAAPAPAAETKPAPSGNKRPWQGTFLGVLNIIGLVFLGIGIIGALILTLGGGALLSQLVEAGGVELGAIIGTIGIVAVIILAAFFVLGVFVTRGLFKGQKWTVILSIIGGGLGIIVGLTDMDIVSIVINAFVLYASIICLKHPFYAKKA